MAASRHFMGSDSRIISLAVSINLCMNAAHSTKLPAYSLPNCMYWLLNNRLIGREYGTHMKEYTSHYTIITLVLPYEFGRCDI